MAGNEKWITPTMKQMFVVLGISLNMSGMGAILGFPAVLLPQLRAPGSQITVDSVSGSWIASIVGLSLLAGNLMVPTLMGKFGRKIASLISCTNILVCWIWLVLATDVTSILIARALQGLSLGINLSLSPIMVGEFTSPSNRGMFSSIMASSITAMTLLVHVAGSYLAWQTASLICAAISFTSLAVLLFSPESPSWLADKGRFEDSRQSYRWLRGDAENEELEKMLEARTVRDENTHRNNIFSYIKKAFSRREFNKPVLIMIHLYMLSLWSGMALLVVYTVDTIHAIVGNDVDVALHITILDVQRTISTIFGLIIIKKLKRRTVLSVTVGLNFATLVSIAAYTYIKANTSLPFDHPAIGLTLLHIHMCSMSTGALPMPIIISGELFPLEFRSLAGGISAIAFSVNYFLTSKTVMLLYNSIGIYGTYALYAAVTFYCLVVILIFLPETKDRTLQDIEEEFRGTPRVKSAEDNAAAIPLNASHKDDEV
ncbi:facilitated trehalose transporter Tret1-like [Ostrinia nubilalis]|uniref:facilitated trehalose transporter Tret1-like n=1 Tax=Ostrinia nubilalis TaxID=29057 RepID=UPI00308252D2